MSTEHPWPEVLSPLPDIETERLALRRFRDNDVSLLEPIFAKPEVWMYPYGRGFTRKETEIFVRAQVEEWNSRGFGCWLATRKIDRQPIGYVGISVPHFLPEILPTVEVGWRFDPDVWGQGYATEGASAALTEAFTTLGLERVCSAPQSENPPSWRMCERLGMSRERFAVAQATEARGPVEVALYWITKGEWLDRQPLSLNECSRTDSGQSPPPTQSTQPK